MGTVYPPFFIAPSLHGGYGEQTSYIRFTMANHENSKLTDALGNESQKIIPQTLLDLTIKCLTSALKFPLTTPCQLPRLLYPFP